MKSKQPRIRQARTVRQSQVKIETLRKKNQSVVSCYYYFANYRHHTEEKRSMSDICSKNKVVNEFLNFFKNIYIR